MYALRLWCLIALLTLSHCQQLTELDASGGGITEPPAIGDDEDAVDEDYFGEYEGEFASGSGTDLPNTTVRATTTVVVIQSTSPTPRNSTKAVVTTVTTKTVRTTTKPLTTTTPADVDDDTEDNFDDLDDENDDGSYTGRNNGEESETEQSSSVRTTSVMIVEKDETTSGFEAYWKHPGFMAGAIGAAVLIVLFLILLILFITYRYQLNRRSDRKYRKGGSRGSQDETGAFWFDDEDGGAIAYSRTSAERYPHAQPQAQMQSYVNQQAATLKGGSSTLRGSQMLTMASGMGAQAQPMLYATPMAPNAQTAYDEYLANLYNQQLYNGYMQKA